MCAFNCKAVGRALRCLSPYLPRNISGRAKPGSCNLGVGPDDSPRKRRGVSCMSGPPFNNISGILGKGGHVFVVQLAHEVHQQRQCRASISSPLHRKTLEFTRVRPLFASCSRARGERVECPRATIMCARRTLRNCPSTAFPPNLGCGTIYGHSLGETPAATRLGLSLTCRLRVRWMYTKPPRSLRLCAVFAEFKISFPYAGPPSRAKKICLRKPAIPVQP